VHVKVAVWLWLERALLALGVVCLGYVAYTSAEARHFQRKQAGAFAEAGGGFTEAPSGAKADAPATSASVVDVEAGSTIAMLEIPRLAISTPVVQGDDERMLDLAAGHLPDTPLPWEGGNSAIAAHRDGLFRPLRNIREGDEIVVRTAQGDFSYTVRETKIVEPTDLSVLEPTDQQTLTLITCYPFNYIGTAPKRFIVHAIRVNGAGVK
jgi:sortase A